MNGSFDMLRATVPVSLNGEPVRVPPGASVAELVAGLGQAAESVAVAVNGNFVPRAERGACTLQAGDQVTCFQAIVGG